MFFILKKKKVNICNLFILMYHYYQIRKFTVRILIDLKIISDCRSLFAVSITFLFRCDEKQ